MIFVPHKEIRYPREESGGRSDGFTGYIKGLDLRDQSESEQPTKKRKTRKLKGK